MENKMLATFLQYLSWSNEIIKSERLIQIMFQYFVLNEIEYLRLTLIFEAQISLYGLWT